MKLSGNKSNIVQSLMEKGVTLEQIREYCREKRPEANISSMRKILSSGKLKGHSWEKAMPSNLHLSIQGLVRDCFAGKTDIDKYLEKGNNIIKHEFFITAVHDLAEQAILTEFKLAIPSIASKSTIDFVLEGVPYDIKVTPPLKNWTFERAKNNPEEFTKSLYEGQDSERIRISAKEDWEFNRFFLVYKDDSLWETPEKMERKIIELIKKNPQSFDVNIDGKNIKTLAVFVE